MNVPNALRDGFLRPRRILSLGLVGCLIAAALAAAQAETIYTYTNSQGDRVFTDEPTKGARKIHVDPPPPIPLTPINLPPATPPPSAPVGSQAAPQSAPQAPLVPSVQMPVTEAPASGSGPRAEPPTVLPPSASKPAPLVSTTVSPAAGGHYQTLSISEPHSGPVAAHPGGTIFVQVQITPALDVSAGDRIRIVIDGEDKVEDSTGHRFMISGLSNGEHTLIALVSRQGKNIFQSSPVVIHLTGAAS
ncbi:hypothetical protein A9404_08160 [Halothiobacillus diazotrophicus]|uniref:DUF4124 domain-containing protein n=1 Tax=Halothiobacillus diazotrophicus TaxID=1860122 RepID=A0A191ZHI6_9GAMM|nr:hypothetical protein [Halothiobacillus diazotrophicus]ANJ67356.1 hypothetical protein A9404_08160 [Halothiobacillus diazotrophicus]